MRRFFADIPSIDLEEISLPEDESKHIFRVLRMKEGDSLEIVNGNGEIFTGKIVLNSPKKVLVKKTNLKKVEKKEYHFHIAIAPTKNNDRIEWFLEKATELGVDEVSLIICDNSERKKVNIDRYRRIIISAMKQSKRIYLPKLNNLTTFSEFIKNHSNGLIAHCHENENRTTTIYREFQENPKLWYANTPILIGPEGDFSLSEVETAISNNYKPISLGDTRLRTETAGIYACTTLKLLHEEAI
ncbi:MAG: 16S rRNA (uracil(1498)-N(3))-methyltransferase [Brumimicrobium sp.]